MKREGYTITDFADFYDFTHKKWWNRNGKKIRRIIPHHMAGNLTPAQFYSIMKSDRQMSPTVAVFTNGEVWAYVPEEECQWTSGGYRNGELVSCWDADSCALTLEIANDGLENTGWHISDKAYKKAVSIIAEWCLRYGIEPIYSKAGFGICMHKDFVATACPGNYLETKILDGSLEKDVRIEIEKQTGREDVKKFVRSLYRKILNRNADVNGLNYWVDEIMKKKSTASNVVRHFFNSKEYIGLKKSNTAFVDDCYNAILQRKADSNGRTYWLQELRHGASREEILEGFLKSKEFSNFKAKYGIK